MAGRGRRVMGIGDGSNGSLGAGSGGFLKPPGLRRGGEGWRGSYPLPPVIGHAAADRESVRIHAESGQNPNIDATRSFDLSYRRAACTQSPRQCNENVKNPCREHGGGAHKRVAFVAGGGVSKCLPAKPEVAANALMSAGAVVTWAPSLLTGDPRLCNTNDIVNDIVGERSRYVSIA